MTEAKPDIADALLAFAKSKGQSPEEFLATYLDAVRQSDYPGPDCLDPDCVEQFVAAGKLSETQEAHVQSCHPCAALIESATPAFPSFEDLLRTANSVDAVDRYEAPPIPADSHFPRSEVVSDLIAAILPVAAIPVVVVIWLVASDSPLPTAAWFVPPFLGLLTWPLLANWSGEGFAELVRRSGGALAGGMAVALTVSGLWASDIESDKRVVRALMESEMGDLALASMQAYAVTGSPTALCSSRKSPVMKFQPSGDTEAFECMATASFTGADVAARLTLDHKGGSLLWDDGSGEVAIGEVLSGVVARVDGKKMLIEAPDGTRRSVQDDDQVLAGGVNEGEHLALMIDPASQSVKRITRIHASLLRGNF